MAERPSISGISISSTMTSTGWRARAAIACRPSATVTAISTSPAPSSVRAIKPRITAESSTIITRMGELGTGGLAGAVSVISLFPRGGDPASEQTDLFELSLHDLHIEGIHNVLIRSLLERLHDVLDLAVGRAEDDLRMAAMRHRPNFLQAFDPGHPRHIPVQKDRIGHVRHAFVERLLAVLRFAACKFQIFHDLTRKPADDATVVDYKTRHHLRSPTSLFSYIGRARTLFTAWIISSRIS